MKFHIARNCQYVMEEDRFNEIIVNSHFIPYGINITFIEKMRIELVQLCENELQVGRENGS